MKTLISVLLFGLVSFSSVSFASSADAIAAFSANAAVKKAVRMLGGMPAVRSDLSAALLSGQCGFAGCGETFLVSQAVSSAGANTSTTAVTALVHSDNGSTYTVELIDVNSILGLTK